MADDTGGPLSEHDWAELESRALAPTGHHAPPPTLGEFLFSPSGRVSRHDYWVKYMLPYWGFLLAATALDAIVGLGGVGFAYTALTVVALWPGIAITIKRLHDLDMSAHWAFVPWIVALVGVIILVAGVVGGSVSTAVAAVGGVLAAGGGLTSLYVMLKSWFAPGSEGPNRFGLPPAT